MEYLDFELPIKELEDQLDKCQIIGAESNVDVTATCKQIEKKTRRNQTQNLQEPYGLATRAIVTTSESPVYARAYHKPH